MSTATSLDTLLDEQSTGDKTTPQTVPSAGRPIKVNHTKTHNEVVELTDVGQITKLVKRKYKNFRIVPVGSVSVAKFGAEGRVVEGAVDESEAKQAFFAAFGAGHEPSKYKVNVFAAE